MRPGRVVLLGHPVAHSLSPAFQNAALKAAGIPLTYEAIDVPPATLERVLDGLRPQRAAGNVTVPHKEAVARLCDVLTPLAKRVGAVNTFWCDADDRLHGDNTDVGGFDAAARALLGDANGRARAAPPGETREVTAGVPEGQCVLLLGAGGSAAAVCEAVSQWPGAQVRIVARTAERAEALARRYPRLVRVLRDFSEALAGATLAVNATPLGLNGDAMPLDPAAIPENACVLDLVYRRGLTPWVRACRARGLRAADGQGMLLEQGALAFTRWFAVAPDRDAMRRALQS